MKNNKVKFKVKGYGKSMEFKIKDGSNIYDVLDKVIIPSLIGLGFNEHTVEKILKDYDEYNDKLTER